MKQNHTTEWKTHHTMGLNSGAQVFYSLNGLYIGAHGCVAKAMTAEFQADASWWSLCLFIPQYTHLKIMMIIEDFPQGTEEANSNIGLFNGQYYFGTSHDEMMIESSKLYTKSTKKTSSSIAATAVMKYCPFCPFISMQKTPSKTPTINIIWSCCDHISVHHHQIHLKLHKGIKIRGLFMILKAVWTGFIKKTLPIHGHHWLVWAWMAYVSMTGLCEYYLWA